MLARALHLSAQVVLVSASLTFAAGVVAVAYMLGGARKAWGVIA